MSLLTATGARMERILRPECSEACIVVLTQLPASILMSRECWPIDLAGQDGLVAPLARARRSLSQCLKNLVLVPSYGAAIATSIAYAADRGIRLLLQRRIRGVVW